MHLSPTEATWRRLRWLAVALAALLILAAARGDLYIDEVWSLTFARLAGSPLDLVRRFKHDNNHPLNTLFLYLLRNQGHIYLLRLLSVVSAIASISLAGHLAARKWGQLEGLFSVLLVGASYPLVLYFSEARGYSPAILCSLAGYACLDGAPGCRPRVRVLAFWLVSVAGFLFHATFIQVSLALALASLVAALREDGALLARARRLLVWHGPPLLAFAGWYLYFLRAMTIGQGSLSSPVTGIRESARLLLSLQDWRLWPGLPLLVAVALVVLGSWRRYRAGEALWAFFPALLLVLPALMLLAVHSRFMYFRYFLVCYSFFLLLLASLLGDLYRRLPERWPLVAWLAVVLLVAGQFRSDLRLLRLGRGGYGAAVAAILARTPEGPVRVGSDHDFRNLLMLSFYAPRLPGGDRIVYVEEAGLAADPPEWFLVHSSDPGYRPREHVRVRGTGNYYTLAGDYPFAGTSGWAWFVFRRDNTEPHADPEPPEPNP